MPADHLIGPARGARHGGNRKPRGVRGQDAVFWSRLIEAPEHRKLDVQFLRDALDDEIGLRRLFERNHSR